MKRKLLEKENPLARELVDALIKRSLRIAFAESCTGGLCAAGVVSVPDASRVLDGSIVTYANEAKMHFLGVDADTIAEFGVVSEQVAGQMATGVAKALCADVGVGVSGIAGPTGATETKPVGLVCFGFLVNGRVYTEAVKFGDIGRNNVREKSVDFVYKRLISLLADVI